MTSEREANFDGIVGPTHSYAGLSYGNVASQNNVGRDASPLRAVLQGFEKMRALVKLGLVQGVLPPHERPFVPALRRFGFSGTDREVVERAAKADATMLAIASSASAMWTANAATVAPSRDTDDGRVHFVVANLENRAHRALEAPQTARTLRATFEDEKRFAVHDALPGGQGFGDEGAANHTRLVGEKGAVHFFVHGRAALGQAPAPQKYPARQTLEASRAAARLMRVRSAVHVQQSPAVIDLGVFHNDVISVGHANVLLAHERAFLHRDAALGSLRDVVPELRVAEVSENELPVADAVTTYLFNSQIVTLPDASRILIAPEETRAHARARGVVERLVADGVLGAVHWFDLRESMQNGGGPACLRLRVALDDDERAAVTPGCLMDEDKIDRLEAWAKKHYRDRLRASDLADPALLDETRTALDVLTQLLGLGSIYPFQLGIDAL